MLLMVEKGIKGGICHVIQKYAKANNKYMKNYDKNIELSYLVYLDASNLYGWSQKSPANGFKWKKASNKGYTLEVDDDYPKDLLNLHGDVSFLSEKMKIRKCNKLVCNTDDKENYVVHMKTFKQALNHRFVLK